MAYSIYIQSSGRTITELGMDCSSPIGGIQLSLDLSGGATVTNVVGGIDAGALPNVSWNVSGNSLIITAISMSGNAIQTGSNLNIFSIEGVGLNSLCFNIGILSDQLGYNTYYPTLDPDCGGTDPVLGCTDPNCPSYNPSATQDDGSCEAYDECGECGGDGPFQCPDGSFECIASDCFGGGSSPCVKGGDNWPACMEQFHGEPPIK